jgi:hypothetical protein
MCTTYHMVMMIHYDHNRRDHPTVDEGIRAGNILGVVAQWLAEPWSFTR